MASGLSRAEQVGLLTCLMLVGLLTGCTRRFNEPAEVLVHPSELVSFEDLFMLEDTLVLDPSVILGWIWFMDADVSGSVLVTDISSDLVHLFAPTGQHEMTYSMDTCLPSDFGHSVWTSRFADNDRVVLTTLEGAVVVFDRSGNCLAAKQTASTIQSFCTLGDSIYTYRGPRGVSTSIMDVYSMDLESEREIGLEPPELYRLNRNYHGIAGRDMACFDSGPWYKYHEDMDARPVYRDFRTVMAQPVFFVRRDQDLPVELDIRDRQKVLDAFPLLTGLYALDEDTRMGVFSDIDDTFRPESVTGRNLFGLSIVSSSKYMSTVPHKAPESARHGYLYFLGPNVPMDDGDVGNQAVIRYRFTPPTDD